LPGIDGSNFASDKDKKGDLKMLKFENGDIIPDVESYFVDDEESDEESDKENENDEKSGN
jgi:hypothetical protein